MWAAVFPLSRWNALLLLTRAPSLTIMEKIFWKKGGDRVNKGEFVDKLAAKTGLTKKDARKALDTMIDLITDALASNEEVLLTGFGKFEARARKESKRINPQTQKRITVPKKVVPAFKPGKNLKDIVAKKLKAVKVGSELRVKKG